MVVCTRYVQDVHGPARLERVGAQNDHFPAGERSIEFMLVLAELLPMFRFEPERIAADPHPRVAPGQGAAELLAPAAGDSPQIELISFEIPLGALKDLDVPVCQTLVKIQNFAA